jgi:hypothetical protein
MGVGARVSLLAGGRRQSRELACGSGFLSQDEPVVRFGLGAADRVDRLEVRWPSGRVDVVEGLPVDRFVSVREGAGLSGSAGPRELAPPAAVPPDAMRRLLAEGRFLDLEGRPAEAPRSRALLLHAWSPAAEGAEGEARILERLRALERPGAAEVLAVAIRSTPAEAKAFVEKHRLGYRVLVAGEAESRALAEAPPAEWRIPHRSYDGLVVVEHASPAALPWTAFLDAAGVRCWYRGPVKAFQAALDLLTPEPGR